MKTYKQNNFILIKLAIFYMFTILYSDTCKPVNYLKDNSRKKTNMCLNLILGGSEVFIQ